MSDYDPNEYTDPLNGEARSYEQRRKYRAEKDRSQQLARATAAHAKRKAAKPTSGFESRIYELKDQLKRAYTRKEKQQISRRLVQYESAHEAWESEQIVKEWEKDFDRSDLAKLASDSIERIKRSGKVLYPHATQEQLDGLIALQEVRHQFPDAGAFGREFFTMLADIEDGEATAADEAAAQADEAKAKAEMDSAKANLARAEAQQRAGKARQILEGE